jgi:hypothetical protein
MIFNLKVTGVLQTRYYMRYWNDELIFRILERIPNNFTEIHIDYYDPINITTTTEEEERNKIEYFELANVLLLHNNNNFPRVTHTQIFNQMFPMPFVPENPNYLIVDLAHIFGYVNNLISSNIKNIPAHHVFYWENKGIYNYNVLYIGYLGEAQHVEGFYNRAMVETNFLEFTPDYKIITWIDRIKLLGYDFKSLIDIYNHQDFPTDIIARPCEQIFKILRKKYTNKWINEKRTNALEVFDYFECVLYNKNNDHAENIDLARNITILVTQMFLESKKDPNDIVNSVIQRFEDSILAIRPNI